MSVRETITLLAPDVVTALYDGLGNRFEDFRANGAPKLAGWCDALGALLHAPPDDAQFAEGCLRVATARLDDQTVALLLKTTVQMRDEPVLRECRPFFEAIAALLLETLARRNEMMHRTVTD